MNLGIFPVNMNNYANKVNFGMAKFTDRGYQMAKQHGDIYESLNEPNKFQNPEFFKKPPMVGKAPFTKYYLENTKSEDGTSEVAAMIVKCGATDNTHTNAQFITQLLATEKDIKKSDDNTKSMIGRAANEVLKKNWDNPELSKIDTLRLLEVAKYGLDDREYVSLNGVIQLSDAQ